MSLGAVSLIGVGVFGVAFFLGGFVKGLAGIGLPLVAIPILTFVFPVSEAIGMTMAPVVISNAWNAWANGGIQEALRRFWPLILTMATTLIIASSLITRVDDDTLLFGAGAVLTGSALALWRRDRFQISPAWERPASVLVGLASGVFGGWSGLFGIPALIFLTSLRLPRAEFVTSISVVYLCGAIPFVAGLLAFGAMSPLLFAVSCAAVAPMIVGLSLAQRLMRRIGDHDFQTFLLIFLALLGASMMIRAL